MAAAGVTTAASAMTPARPTAAGSAATRSSISTAIPTAAIPTAAHVLHFVAVEIWLRLFFEIASTFNRYGSSSALALGRSFAPAHLRALFFENRFARQPNAIAFYGQHFHQNLVAFF